MENRAHDYLPVAPRAGALGVFSGGAQSRPGVPPEFSGLDTTVRLIEQLVNVMKQQQRQTDLRSEFPGLLVKTWKQTTNPMIGP